MTLVERTIGVLLAWAILIVADTRAADTTADRLAAIERRLAAVEQLVTSTTRPTAPVTPTPAPIPVPTPEPVPNETKPTVDALGLVRSGTVENKVIRTVRKGEIGVQVIGDGVVLRNLSFASDGGYLAQINNRGVTVDGFEASTFFDYAIYAQGAQDLTVRRMNVVGGSTNESILRLDNVKNFTLEDSTLDYRPVTKRKAVLRGFGSGIVINRCNFYGGGSGVVGLTPMTGFDAGEAYIAGGMLRITQSPWIITLDNRAEWEAMVRALIVSGLDDPEAILRECLKRLPVRVSLNGQLVTLDASKVDVALTVSERARYLAQRAESSFTACTFVDAPIRNSAGGTQIYTDCTITAAGEPFAGWNEPTYPNPQYLLPLDVKRPAPVTRFTRCTFRAGWTREQFENFCNTMGIVLIDCTYNGVAIGGAP